MNPGQLWKQCAGTTGSVSPGRDVNYASFWNCLAFYWGDMCCWSVHCYSTVFNIRPHDFGYLPAHFVASLKDNTTFISISFMMWGLGSGFFSKHWLKQHSAGFILASETPGAPWAPVKLHWVLLWLYQDRVLPQGPTSLMMCFSIHGSINSHEHTHTHTSITWPSIPVSMADWYYV